MFWIRSTQKWGRTMENNHRELWDIQQKFTEKFWATKGGMPDINNEKIMTDVTKDYALHLLAEVTEVVQELSFRMHRASKGPVDRSNLAEELIDCQKFLLGMFQIWGFTFDQYAEEFKRKSTVVDQRFTQEQTLPSLGNHPCCLVDLDGVLTDYPRCFYEWAIDTTYKDHSLTEFIRLYKSMNLLQRDGLKTKYRQSGVKANLPLVPGAKELLNLIRKNSLLKIILITNRPYAEFYRLYPDTLAFLAKHELPFDGIIWSRDKGIDALKNFKNICWAVDDSIENVNRFREANITTIHIRNEFESSSTRALYLLAEQSNKLEDLGYDWAKRQSEVPV